MILTASFSFTSSWWTMSASILGFILSRLFECIHYTRIMKHRIHWTLFIESESVSFLRFRLCSIGLSSCIRTSTSWSTCSNFLFEPAEIFPPEADVSPGCGRSLGFFFFTLSGFGPLGPFLFRVGWMDVDVLATDFNSGNVAWRVRSSF